MKNIRWAHLLAVGLLGGALIPAVAPAQPASAATASTITVQPSQVVNPDFYGVGVDIIPSALMPNNRSLGYDDAYWQMDQKRIQTLKPKVARLWFQPDWFETAKGTYSWTTTKMQAFYQYLDALQAAGTEIELNYGWKVGRDIQSWYDLPGVPPDISAPADLSDFAAGASALLDQLITVRGYSNIAYLTFYNEPNGSWDFAAPSDEVGYYASMARAVHNRLVADGRRNLVKIWGPEEWNSLPWTQYMADHADDVFDAYSFHVYGGTYSSLSTEISSRRDAVGSKPLVLSEFGFQGTYDSWWDAGYANYVIKGANEGLSAALVWQLNGVWLEDPQEETDTNDTYTLWDTLLTAASPNPRYYEAGLLERYIPAHSQVVSTSTDSDDVRAAAFTTPGGDYTVVVETNEGTDARALTVGFSGTAVGKTFRRFVYNEDVTPEPNALLPAASGSFSTGSSFTDGGVSAQRNVIVYTTLAPQGQIAVSPTSATTTSGSTVQLGASVIDVSGGVDWSVVGSGNGSVTSAGAFTAPTVTEPRRIAIRATSTADPSVSGIALVLVNPAHVAGTVDLPEFDLAQGTYAGSRTVTISTATSGASIRYTIDGTTPTASSPLYGGPLTVSSTRVIKAKAFAAGLTASGTAQRLYRILSAADGPAGSTSCGFQDAVCAFPGIATVYYGANGSYYSAVFDRRTRCDDRTFGGDPAPGTQKRCFYVPSSIARADKPVIAPGSGAYSEPKTVTISAPASGGTVHYTIDGTLPTTSSPTYTGSFTVSSTATVKAITVRSGVADSPLAVAYLDVTDTTGGPSGYTYCAGEFGTCTFSGTRSVAFGADGSFDYGTFTGSVQCAASSFGGTDPAPNRQKKCFYQSSAPVTVAAPTFSPAGGTFSSAQSVSLSSSTSGASIRYTTDGSTPSSSSTLYSGPIAVTSTTTIKAIALKSGATDSAVASATFTISGGSGGPAGYTECANEFGTCTFSGTRSVAFGADGSFNYGTFTGSVQCVASNFGGDPAYNVAKKCYVS
ncbi:chitobiase/beta-hexosaminidase C-terminal domain-containing protein [Galbitalea sp. SE-J8]|uniref:chitobiase/beta-hexosaminidase C-terminal domain-containing protein n=1 Tax=Galbitalea sp. SE-J8 TaxID=3054952 RepID=UPI00259D037B|nr:chitobiase/beta-hexosaminidase C-terminal domain-containing protein [Galbitalea sp. SE-J8]MDM4762068.1 chitobiase/beta-hexosaminidase C-terminal domain-containing protein [Galbitalea sp. SE-J8]